MKIINSITICLCILLGLVVCKKDSKLQDKKTNIRIFNNSIYDFTDVILNPSQGNKYYGDIKKNEKTEYKVFDIVYRYAYIKLLINGKEYIYQPYDYVGETPLGQGNFTYEITVGDTSNIYSIQIVANKD